MENLDNLIDEISKETEGVEDNLDVQDYAEVEVNVPEKPEEIIEDEYTEPENHEEESMKIEDVAVKHIIYAKFNSNKILTKLISTGDKNTIFIRTNRVKLSSGKYYFIPVNSNIDSDEYTTIKMYSDTATLLDVKYVKDGIACISAVSNNAVIEDGQRICLIC